MDAGLRLTSAAFAYGEIVWVRRPDAGVKFEGRQRGPRAMVSRKAGSPGRSRISRKAIAWGRPVCSPLNLYARGQHIPMQHACETAGAARTRSSPRPLWFEGERDGKLRAHRAARTRAYAYQRHVWTAPSRQGLSWCFGKRSGSGHVYGLEMRPLTAGLDGER
jgi:hypothetical protein